MKQWKFNEFCQLAKKNGYCFFRVKGSHHIYKNDRGQHMSIPLKLESVIARRLIKENQLKQ